jgi:WD40 repeat protein
MLYTSEGRYLDTLYGGAGWVGGLGFSPDGAYLAALGYDNGFRVWDVKTRKRLGTVQLQAITGDFWISPDETKLLTKGKTWDLQSGKPLSAAIKLTGTPLVFRADGKLLIYSDKQVVVHDIATGEDINKVPAEWTLAGIVLSRDGSRLAYGGVSRGEPSVMVVDTNTGAILKTFERYFDEPPSDLLLSPDNRLLVVVDFRHVDERGQYHLLIWEIASGNLLTDQDVGADFVSHLDYSPRGDRIAWVSIGPESEHSPRTLHILNVNSREVASVKLSFDFVSTVKFSTDGSLVAIGDSVGSIHLYDAQTGLEAAVLTGHTGWVRQLTFNTDGSRLYSSGDDGLLRVWGLP